MAVYMIEDAVFKMFPMFRRGVIAATRINNNASAEQSAAVLADAISGVEGTPSLREEERISVWNEAYWRIGVDPERHTPSIRFLFQQMRRGKPPRPINPVVNIMNAVSIRHVTPCGGDDRSSLLGGDFRLGMAHGDETFAPLFKPNIIEHPDPGEIIYYSPQIRRVMCRRWTWRNADFSKLTPQSSSVVINIDMMMPPLDELEMQKALGDISSMLSTLCGAETRCFVLSPDNPVIQLDNV